MRSPVTHGTGFSRSDVAARSRNEIFSRAARFATVFVVVAASFSAVAIQLLSLIHI